MAADCVISYLFNSGELQKTADINKGLWERRFWKVNTGKWRHLIWNCVLRALPENAGGRHSRRAPAQACEPQTHREAGT